MSLLDPVGAVRRKIFAGIAIAGAVMLLVLLAWALRLDDLRAGWRGKFDALTEQSAGVLTATRIASDNDDLTWENVPGQVVALGEDKRALEAAISTQNATIEDMAREAVRLRARADELKAIADRAQAQRQAALARLSDMAITPGTRDDCMQLLREAEAALDLVYEAGL